MSGDAPTKRRGLVNTSAKGEIPLARTLAEFAAGLSLADLDTTVVEKAKLHLLDTIGAALPGMATPEGRAAAKALAATSGPVQGHSSPIWGTPLTAPPTTAALVNGIGAHALELDDSDGCDHSGAVVVPALIAALDHAPGATGADVLLATVVGYEVARRALDASGGHPACNGLGWHSTGTCGSFGAAAAAATLLGLPPDEHASALGLAGSFTGGLWAFIEDGAMSKRLHAGKAAQNGLTAALLAREGFTGPAYIFEAPWGGYFSTYVPATADASALINGLGQSWRISCASFKPYASCRDTHSAIDVALAWRSSKLVTPETIDLIEVTVSEFIDRMCGGRNITSVVDAQMSLPFSVAAALVHGRFGLTEIGSAARTNRTVNALMDRVRLRIDPAMVPGAPVRLRAHLSDGTVHTAASRPPLGSVENPLSTDRLVEKFTDLAGYVLPGDQVARLVETVLALDRIEDPRRFVHLLQGVAIPETID
jgi:2-methylcitrate dehydratase PrpD